MAKLDKYPPSLLKNLSSTLSCARGILLNGWMSGNAQFLKREKEGVMNRSWQRYLSIVIPTPWNHILFPYRLILGGQRRVFPWLLKNVSPTWSLIIGILPGGWFPTNAQFLNSTDGVWNWTFLTSLKDAILIPPTPYLFAKSFNPWRKSPHMYLIIGNVSPTSPFSIGVLLNGYVATNATFRNVTNMIWEIEHGDAA